MILLLVGCLIFFFLIAIMADWDQKILRVPALGDQVKCQVYCIDLSAENRGSLGRCFLI